ncbi:MAG: hydrolase TatD [Halobacteriovoraceae bacterium]|nr:hydrolase TatD [Halobacteriovoraceae bacterium]|tara:strand:+ start:21421 stop:22194 length:774 start_codon:yes stop_codon:yes gene_type:complete
MTYKLLETHCHLDYLKAKSLEDILDDSQKAGVEKFLTIGVEPDNFDAVFELSQKYPKIYFTQGIHPHDAKLATEDAFQVIRKRSSESKMLAVGEIGLDYYYDNSPREKQIEVFKEQLQIAIEVDKPVVIHTRDADEDTIEILSEYAPKMKRKGVIHSFTAGAELAQLAIDLGFYLGFNGIITFKKAENVRDIVRLCPLEKILLETDSPFLTPVPHRGKENNPSYLPHILEKVAEIKNIAPREVEEQCYQNSIDLFRF